MNYRRPKKSTPKPKIDIQKVWVLVFLIWGVLLTGVFSFKRGSPGFLQAFRLKQLLLNREDLLHTYESQIQILENERDILEHSPSAQEREIRRVLGYAYSDELIFDFSAAKFIK